MPFAKDGFRRAQKDKSKGNFDDKIFILRPLIDISKKDLIYISIIIITIVGFSLYTKEIRTKQLNYCYQMFKTFTLNGSQKVWQKKTSRM